MATRSGFSSKIGFILAAAGSAVGLGNIWKFPFEVGEGGGAAFLIMYLIFCFILCFPVMLTEIAIGRKTQLNPVGAFKKLGFPKWASVGFLGILSGVFILSFYNVVAGWALGYFVEMIQGNFEIGKKFGEFTNNAVLISIWSLLFMAATAFIVSKGISGGIEKASKILMPVLVILILSLVAYAFTLEHAMTGISFYLVPDFSEITLEVALNALGQAFFSLSLGMGALITYGSYVGKKDNIVSSAAFITMTDVGIAFIAGLMMFPFVAYITNGTMEGVDGGPGLIFVTLPGVFESFGATLGIIVGAVFFLLLSFAALTSTVSLLEVPVSYFVDEIKIKRTNAVWLIAGFIYLLGIPSMLSQGSVPALNKFLTYPSGESIDFMTFIENLSSNTFLPLGGLLITLFAGYVWKKENLMEEIEQGFPGTFKGSFLSKYISFCICYLCPIVLGVIFILTISDVYFGVNLISYFTE
ncbi:sodium-dependent transporter [Marinigracilibium pacificum]|uniref:Sodium-dependent transporter n=1 Tax=Marinigracilibium pacificum TaxID=2729599 RepID=A0A848IV06_9BACT|nr:sodium-dependent transporter [Marinigracilibium pacificum]NMM47018.1 sodium-dependent transporter [Marinigracilibium pacificum]